MGGVGYHGRGFFYTDPFFKHLNSAKPMEWCPLTHSFHFFFLRILLHRKYRRQSLVLLYVLPTNWASDTLTERPICWQNRQLNRPLSDSPVKTTIESVTLICSPGGQAGHVTGHMRKVPEF